MLEKTTSMRRRAAASRFQRYAPIPSLFLSTAVLALTTLVILPGTKKGPLDNFRLIALNTTNIGANIFQFTPISTQLESVQDSANKEDPSSNPAPSNCNSAYTEATSTINSSSCTDGTNPTPSPSPWSPTSHVFPKRNFSQEICSCANSSSEPMANIIEDITSGIEGGIGSFLQGIIQNVTRSIETSPTSGASEVGLFLEGLLKNETSGEGNRTSPETSIDTFIQDLIAGIFSGAERRILNALTGSGSGLKVLLTAIINNFTTKVDNGLSKAEGSVAAGITNALGLQQFYSVHLRDVCSGTLSSSFDPHAKFNITACFPYSAAASGLVDLISKIPSSTTVLTTNITIPVVSQVQEMSIYLTNLTNTLDQVIFAFYMIALISSGLVILGSIAQFMFPTSGAVMYANIMTSTLSVASSLSASAVTTGFITTTSNIINIFGSALGLRAELSSDFLALTWTSFAVALLTNWYLIAVWFVEFRTISVKVQRRSPQDMSGRRQFGIFRESKGGFVEETVQEVIEERPDPNIGGNTSMTIRRLSSRFVRRSSVTANF